jgi:hypothetical protein
MSGDVLHGHFPDGDDGMAPTEMRRIGIDLDDRRLVQMELGGLDLGTRRAEVCI